MTRPLTPVDDTLGAALHELLQTAGAKVLLWNSLVVRHGTLVWATTRVLGDDLLRASVQQLQWRPVADVQGLETTSELPVSFHLGWGGDHFFEAWQGPTHAMLPVPSEEQLHELPKYRASAWIGTDRRLFGLLTVAHDRALSSTKLAKCAPLLRALHDVLTPRYEPQPKHRTGTLLLDKDRNVVGGDAAGMEALDDPTLRRAMIDATGRLATTPGAVVRRTDLKGGVAAELVTVHPVRQPVFPVGALLTSKQREVADLLLRSMTVAEISKEIGRAKSTVESHRKALYHTLGVATRVELADRLLTL